MSRILAVGFFSPRGFKLVSSVILYFPLDVLFFVTFPNANGAEIFAEKSNSEYLCIVLYKNHIVVVRIFRRHDNRRVRALRSDKAFGPAGERTKETRRKKKYNMKKIRKKYPYEIPRGRLRQSRSADLRWMRRGAEGNLLSPPPRHSWPPQTPVQ